VTPISLVPTKSLVVPNAGGPRQLPIRTRWAARIAQFCRSVTAYDEIE